MMANNFILIKKLYSLLSFRAIENQCYVIAAAQIGRHNAKRASYGHSVIIDPWGTIVAACAEAEGIAVAEIDHFRSVCLIFKNSVKIEISGIYWKHVKECD